MSCCSSSTSSRARGAARLPLLLLLLGLGSCATIAAPRHPREPLPVPTAVAERYALGGEITEDYLVPLDDERRTFRGRLTVGDEHPEFHLVLPKQTPAPFLLCLPILAGGRDLMWYVANRMAERGYAVAWGKRVESAMKPHQSVDYVEDLFQRSIRHNRAVLGWAQRQAWIRPGKVCLLGISTGGILGGTLLALESELRGGVLILAGGDLPDLLRHSTEGRIERWRESRQSRAGMDETGLLRKMRESLTSDPARLAPYVPTDKVFMVTAELDTVIPERNRDLLWEGFGRPARLQLPLLSHYSAILGIKTILSRADAFLSRRLRDARPTLGIATEKRP